MFNTMLLNIYICNVAFHCVLYQKFNLIKVNVKMSLLTVKRSNYFVLCNTVHIQYNDHLIKRPFHYNNENRSEIQWWEKLKGATIKKIF